MNCNPDVYHLELRRYMLTNYDELKRLLGVVNKYLAISPEALSLTDIKEAVLGLGANVTNFEIRFPLIQDIATNHSNVPQMCKNILDIFNKDYTLLKAYSEQVLNVTHTHDDTIFTLAHGNWIEYFSTMREGFIFQSRGLEEIHAAFKSYPNTCGNGLFSTLANEKLRLLYIIQYLSEYINDGPNAMHTAILAENVLY